MADEPESGEHEDEEFEVDVGSVDDNLGNILRSTRRKNPWSLEEKRVFEKGLELFGHKWTQIAELLETRSPMQVKTYAKKYLQQKSKEESESLILISALTSSKVVLQMEDTNEELDIEDLTAGDQVVSTCREGDKSNEVEDPSRKNSNDDSPCIDHDKKHLKNDFHRQKDNNTDFNCTNARHCQEEYPSKPIETVTPVEAGVNCLPRESCGNATSETNTDASGALLRDLVDREENGECHERICQSQDPSTSHVITLPQSTSYQTLSESNVTANLIVSSSCVSSCTSLSRTECTITEDAIHPRTTIPSICPATVQERTNDMDNNDDVVSNQGKTASSPVYQNTAVSRNNCPSPCASTVMLGSDSIMSTSEMATSRAQGQSPLGNTQRGRSPTNDIIPQDEATKICNALLEAMSPTTKARDEEGKLPISIKLESLENRPYKDHLGSPSMTVAELNRCVKQSNFSTPSSCGNGDQEHSPSRVSETDQKRSVPCNRQRSSRQGRARTSMRLPKRTTRHSKPIQDMPDKLEISIKLCDLRQDEEDDERVRPTCSLTIQTVNEGWNMQQTSNSRSLCVDDIRVDRSVFGVIKHKVLEEDGKVSEKIEILGTKPVANDHEVLQSGKLVLESNVKVPGREICQSENVDSPLPSKESPSIAMKLLEPEETKSALDSAPLLSSENDEVSPSKESNSQTEPDDCVVSSTNGSDEGPLLAHRESTMDINGVASQIGGSMDITKSDKNEENAAVSRSHDEEPRLDSPLVEEIADLGRLVHVVGTAETQNNENNSDITKLGFESGPSKNDHLSGKMIVECCEKKISENQIFPGDNFDAKYSHVSTFIYKGPERIADKVNQNVQYVNENAALSADDTDSERSTEDVTENIDDAISGAIQRGEDMVRHESQDQQNMDHRFGAEDLECHGHDLTNSDEILECRPCSSVYNPCMGDEEQDIAVESDGMKCESVTGYGPTAASDLGLPALSLPNEKSFYSEHKFETEAFSDIDRCDSIIDRDPFNHCLLDGSAASPSSCRDQGSIDKDFSIDRNVECSRRLDTGGWSGGFSLDSECRAENESLQPISDAAKLRSDPFISATENSDSKLVSEYSLMEKFTPSDASSSPSAASEESYQLGHDSQFDCSVQLTEMPVMDMMYAKDNSDGYSSSSSTDNDDDDGDDDDMEGSGSDNNSSDSSSSSGSSSYTQSDATDDESDGDDSGSDENSKDAIARITSAREETREVGGPKETQEPPLVEMKELIFKPGFISSIERKECREFFMGKHSKTPERYLEIRDFIIREWNKIRPLYLTKNSIRSKASPTEANSVGRVHVFLENHGAINVGCTVRNKWVERMEKRRAKYCNSAKIDAGESANERPKTKALIQSTATEQYDDYTQPTQELILDFEEITDDEKKAHPKFFSGNKHKSPDKYLKIRNSIINCWRDSKPMYLTKKAARIAMSWYCGDVNTISRVHDYLEQVGAINFGCAQEPRRGRPSRARMNQERHVSRVESSQRGKIRRKLPKSELEPMFEEHENNSIVESYHKRSLTLNAVSLSLNEMNSSTGKAHMLKDLAQRNAISISQGELPKKKRGRKPKLRPPDPDFTISSNQSNSKDVTGSPKLGLDPGRDYITDRDTGPPSDKSSVGDSGIDSISEVSPVIELGSMSSKILGLREDSNQAPLEGSEDSFQSEERFLDLNFITEEEKSGCPEFFIGSKVKPPEKYTKIRNSIIKSWEKKKPFYLNKHNARCEMPWYTGDINSIGRVHAFLESIGVINYGAVFKPKRCKRNVGNRKRDFENSPKYDIPSPETEDDDEMSEKMLDDDVLNIDEVTESEKETFKRFFMPVNGDEWMSSTYIKVRNVITDMWSKCKPEYLNKPTVLGRFEGDYDALNAVAEVHTFLEAVGLINVGFSDSHAAKNGIWNLNRRFNLGLRPRKRGRMDINYDWVDRSESEGLTIKHFGPDEERMEARPRSLVYTSNKIRKSLPESDPYKLVPCRTFPSDSATPFTVTICLKSLLVMDFHSYLSSSEVIGLVGGKYYHATRRLEILRVAPCSNVGTNLQCEMDPVSQAKASNDLAQHGLEVVGWYHSHPTFAPTPSLRDIDTQSTFQEWFSRAGAPFVGIIISPYNMSHIESPHKSQITCLTISDQWDESKSYRIPYMFKFKTEDLEKSDSFDDTTEQLKSTMRTVDGCQRYLCEGKLGNSPPGLLLLKSFEAKLNRKTAKKEEFLCQVKNLIGF